jgi:hypothetical protein
VLEGCAHAQREGLSVEEVVVMSMEAWAVAMERWLGEQTTPEAMWVRFRAECPELSDATLIELVGWMLSVGRLQPAKGTPMRPDGLPVRVQLPAWRWPITGRR